MNSNMEWRWPELPVEESQIARIQVELGVRLPDDFLQLVRKYNGGYPSKKYFDFPSRKDAVLDHLLSLIEGGDDPSLLNTYRNVRDRLPSGIIPFASDPFGNLICFDYRDNPPSICFWDHEIASRDISASIITVNENLEQFLAKLRA